MTPAQRNAKVQAEILRRAEERERNKTYMTPEQMRATKAVQTVKAAEKALEIQKKIAYEQFSKCFPPGDPTTTDCPYYWQERSGFTTHDIDAVDQKFHKAVLDTAKIKAYVELEAELPSGVEFKPTIALCEKTSKMMGA